MGVRGWQPRQVPHPLPDVLCAQQLQHLERVAPARDAPALLRDRAHRRAWREVAVAAQELRMAEGEAPHGAREVGPGA